MGEYGAVTVDMHPPRPPTLYVMTHMDAVSAPVAPCCVLGSHGTNLLRAFVPMMACLSLRSDGFRSMFDLRHIPRRMDAMSAHPTGVMSRPMMTTSDRSRMGLKMVIRFLHFLSVLVGVVGILVGVDDAV